MTEVDPSKLNADSHLLLDQPLLRLPLELQRRNFKKSQQYIDHEQKQVLNLLKDATKKATSQPSDQTLQDIDNMIKRMEGLKRKLELLNAEEDTILDHSFKRIRHLQELYEIPNLIDVKYEKWSRTRLDRLVVDYLLRSGFTDTATALAQARNIADLIDLDAFISCHKIADSIAMGQTAEALVWVKDNRDGLKKLLEKDPASTVNKSSINGATLITPPKITSLEFELRFQEYLELLRPGSQNPNAQFDALVHAQKYLKPHESHFALRISTAVGLLAQDPRNPEGPYADSFSPSRWTFLRNLFIETHHQMLNLPIRPLIHVALSAGLSALKTPACHSRFNPASAATDDHPKLASSQTLTSTNASSDSSNSKVASTTSMSLGGLCPICSTELNDLARPVPYAHHTVSYVEGDAMVLPNGRVYGRHRLEELQRKLLRVQGLVGAGLSGSSDDGEDLIGRADMEVRDPVTGEEFLWQDVRRVYIS